MDLQEGCVAGTATIRSDLEVLILRLAKESPTWGYGKLEGELGKHSKFPVAFDTVFTSGDVMIVRTLVQAPNANTFAELWIRSTREECLGRVFILGERHLGHVLTAYADYYNHARPHQGIAQQCPVPSQRNTARDGPIERRDMLGGVLHDYYRRAA